MRPKELWTEKWQNEVKITKYLWKANQNHHENWPGRMRGGAVRTICRAPNKDLSRVGSWQGKMPIGYAGWSHGWQDIGGLLVQGLAPDMWAQSLHLEAPMPPTACNTHQRPLFVVHCQCTWRIALSSCRDSHLKHPLPRVRDNQSSKHDVAWWGVCVDPGLQRVLGQ